MHDIWVLYLGTAPDVGGPTTPQVGIQRAAEPADDFRRPSQTPLRVVPGANLPRGLSGIESVPEVSALIEAADQRVVVARRDLAGLFVDAEGTALVGASGLPATRPKGDAPQTVPAGLGIPLGRVPRALRRFAALRDAIQGGGVGQVAGESRWCGQDLDVVAADGRARVSAAHAGHVLRTGVRRRRGAGLAAPRVRCVGMPGVAEQPRVGRRVGGGVLARPWRGSRVTGDEPPGDEKAFDDSAAVHVPRTPRPRGVSHDARR